MYTFYTCLMARNVISYYYRHLSNVFSLKNITNQITCYYKIVLIIYLVCIADAGSRYAKQCHFHHRICTLRSAADVCC